MVQDDDARRRWARPGPPRADGGAAPTDDDLAVDQPPHSAASHWTRGPRQPREPVEASGVPVPALPATEPPVRPAEAERESRMWPVAAGVAALAVLACTPHWVAPTIALMVSLVGIPIAWGFRRISHGRRRVQYVVVVLTLLLTATLSVVAPTLWLQLGVLQPIAVPT